MRLVSEYTQVLRSFQKVDWNMAFLRVVGFKISVKEEGGDWILYRSGTDLVVSNPYENFQANTSLYSWYDKVETHFKLFE